MNDLPLAAAVFALTACATADAQAVSAQDRADDGPAPNVVVVEFRAGGAAAGDQAGRGSSPQDGRRSGQAGASVSIPEVLARAEAPELARLVLNDPPDAPASAEGTLLFDDVASLARWRQRRMEDFLAPMGGEDAVTTTIRIVNKDVLGAYGLGGTRAGLENLSITYTNTGHDTGGADADIDAVTVVCPGDFAECSPSN